MEFLPSHHVAKTLPPHLPLYTFSLDHDFFLIPNSCEVSLNDPTSVGTKSKSSFWGQVLARQGKKVALLRVAA